MHLRATEIITKDLLVHPKYGERFIEAITAFIDENPDSVTSIKDDDDAADVRVKSARKRKSRKGPFYLNPEDEEEDVAKNTSFDRAAYNRKMYRPDGAGASWSEEEDKQLDEEFNSGMKISEMAKIHDRTNGAIRARLRKHGRIE